MTGHRRTRVLAALDERIAGCREATAGDPTTMLALYGFLLGEVERHEPKTRQSRGRPGVHDCLSCGATWDDGCPFIHRLAAALRVSP